MHFLKWLVQLPKKVPPATAVGEDGGSAAVGRGSGALDSAPASAAVRNSRAASPATGSAAANGRKPRAQSAAAAPLSARGAGGGGGKTTAANNAPPVPKVDPTVISALLSIQREIERLEAEAIAKGGPLAAANSSSSDSPPLAFADVQARQEQRDALSATLSDIAGLVALSAEKAAKARAPACPLQLELQRVFA